MGTTAEKLTYLNTTKGKIKDSINLTGAGITNQDTFRSYASKLKLGYIDIINNGTDTLYSNFPKVSEIGSELSLTPTYEAPMRNLPLGNTYQQTYTGKNKLNLVNDSSRGVSGTVNADGTVTISGKATATTGIPVFSTSQTLTSGTYTLSINKALPFLINFTPASGISWRIQAGSTSATTTISNDMNTGSLFMAVENGVTYNETFKIQLVSGSTPDYNFEPYVGGVSSPNPNYPQAIQSATGLQNVNITGKNLLDISQNLNSTNRGIDYILNDDGSITLNGTATATYSYVTGTVTLTEPLKIGTYTYSIDHAISGQWRIIITYDDNTQETKAIMPGNTSITFTTTKKITKYYVSFSNITQDETYNETLFIQLEYGSTATSYEPYKSNTYEVNLGKNLSRIEDGTATINGLTITVENGTITLNGTTTASSVFKLTNGLDTISDSRPNTNWFSENVVDKLAGKVLSINNISGSGPSSSWAIRLFKSTTTYSYQYTPSNFDGDKVYTTGENISCICIFLNGNLTFDNYKIQMQLEKGTKSTSFSPYFTPIELNKINTYQDSIKKSTGKNLFDKNTALILDGSINNSTNELALATGFKTLIFNCEPNTTYTISKISSSRFNVGLYDENITSSSLPVTLTDVTSNGTATSKTITTNSDTKCIAVMYYRQASDTITAQQILDSIQIEQGSTATSYEPYGKVWYIKKNTNSVILDGTESGWGNYTNGTTGLLTFRKQLNEIKSYTQSVNIICDYFSRGGTNPLNNQFTNRYGNNQNLEFVYTDITSLADFKTWLGINNIKLVYALTTPVITEITNTELINQLETLYTAKSQEGTTNISITSEYLPMLLSASALEMTD